MDIDDFVETSDVEELQELGDEANRALSSSRQRDGSFGAYSPRKRIKVCLVVCVLSVANLHVYSKLYHGALDDNEITRPYFASSMSKYDETHSRSPTTLKPTSPAQLLSCLTSQLSDVPFQSRTSIKQFTSSSRSRTPILESPSTSLPTSILTTKNISLSSSSGPDQIAVTFNLSTTPTNSPPRPRCRLSSPELRTSPPKSPISSPDLLLEVLSARSLDDKDDDDDDELLLVTPVKSSSVDRPSSPLTPSTPKSPLLSSDTIDRDIRDLSQSPFQHFLAFSVSPRSPSQALPPPEEVPVLAEEVQEQRLDGPRYSLRHRKAAQLKPYTVDQLKYKQALRANPEAIVKFKNLALRSHHHHPEDRYEEDGETQKDGYIDDGNHDEDDAEWEEREKRREETSRKETNNDKQSSAPDCALFEPRRISYPEILQELSSTDEEEADILSHSHSKQPESSDIEIQLPRSKKRALARMLPKSMAFALVKQAATSTTAKKHRRSSTPPASVSDDDEGPLLPGHTRTHKAGNPKDIRDIKGDSESEQEIGDDVDKRSSASGRGSRRGSISDSSSVSDEVEFVDSFRRQRRAPQIVDLVSDSSTSSEDEMEDLAIQAHIAHTPFSGHSRSQSDSGRRREVSLIDWMLTRTRTIGGKRRERKNGGSGRKRVGDGSSKFKFDIVKQRDPKHGHERQTLLSFDGHEKSKKGGYRPKDASATVEAFSLSRPSERISVHKDDAMDNVVDHVLEDQRKISRKERERARRARAKKQGRYTFTSKGGTHIERGRRQTAFITVDLQDEGFHHALAPQHDRTQTQNWASMFKPMPEPLPAQSRDKISNEDQQESMVPQVKPKKRQERVIPGDLGITLLHSGKSFGFSTFIRKGWLHELLGLIMSSTQEPVLPPSTNSCGFELGPTMGADQLVSILQDICSTLFEFVTDLPDVESDTTIKGAVIMRVVPLLISWFRKTEDESVFASVREAGEREIARLVGKIQKLVLPFVDMSILATCWFAVEMCARLGCRLDGQSQTGILKQSAMTLINLLLQVGLEKPITMVKSSTDLTEPSVPQFAAELWVSLIHLLGECDSLEKTNRRIHPFWSLLMVAMQSQPEGQKPRTNLEASETIWYTIFSVCALSQYSVHGMTTGLPRLPACWDLVVFALKKIRLNEDPKTDLGMSSDMLLQRDKYIGLVMTRCFHLRERWRWKLDDASVLFNQLAVIFRSRKFVNLRHEGTGYPKFFKDRNWDLLASYDPKDTAFVVFVKLIVQAAKDDQGSVEGKLSLKVKKLLSLAVPVASLPFSKTNPPTLHELTMFYNRLSAVAIAVYLEPDGYDFRTRQAREYIKFADADDTTRSAVIGGMMNWAIMIVNRETKLDAITTWIGEMAQVLSVELKETSLKVTADESKRVLLSCVLLGAVRHILTAYIGLGRYPDPSLLCKLHNRFIVLVSLVNDRCSESQAHHAFFIQQRRF